MATFFVGTSVMNHAPLAAITLDALWQRLRHDAVLREEVARLRKVKRLDLAAYHRLKVGLPYFCCATFGNGVRHSQNFVSVSAFVVDIDKYSGEVSRLEALRNRICADERVAMCFISPSGDGLKVLFQLAEPCLNLKEYSDFYKSFVYDWAKLMEVEQFVDLRTTDATRACFLSHDPLAYINPMSETVVLQRFAEANLAFESVASDAIVAVVEPMAKVAAAPKAAPVPKSFDPEANCSHHIQPSAYSEVLAALKTKARPNPLQRNTVVPEPLVHLMSPLAKAFSQHGIAVISVRDVQYGKQCQMQCGNDLAELNIYYGKKGFSVVASMKRETNPTLCELCVHLAEQTIFALYVEYHVPDVSLN
jgi:VirE N-terminal domain